MSPKKLKALLERPELLENKKFKALLASAPTGLAKPFGLAQSGLSPLSSFVQELSFAEKFSCPICGRTEGAAFDKVVARTRSHTFRRCKNCGGLYLAFSSDSRVQYEADYFGSEYKAQYGRTYLDDFDSIKAQGLRRAKIILSAGHFGGSSGPLKSPPRLLDIGCAYGPFLSAAKDLGFEPYGTDISQSALDYVKYSLGFYCILSSFADFDVKKLFGFEAFDAVTMWYVIEHCRDLKSLLLRVNALLR
ncbi:MAG: methyltransferase domain-containing protein [Treponema sp.]|nr:methyltransferase domain-containing protein [Treponema sp.]